MSKRVNNKRGNKIRAKSGPEERTRDRVKPPVGQPCRVRASYGMRAINSSISGRTKFEKLIMRGLLLNWVSGG